jgi:hypothetical protein
LALLGWKRSPWFLAVGIATHGIAWDAWHFKTSPFIPDWYCVFCLAIDLTLAVYVALRVRRYAANSTVIRFLGKYN